MAIVFREESPGRFDLTVDGRAAEYDLEPDEFSAALRRRRIRPSVDNPVWVEALDGYRTKMGR